MIRPCIATRDKATASFVIFSATRLGAPASRIFERFGFRFQAGDFAFESFHFARCIVLFPRTGELLAQASADGGG